MFKPLYRNLKTGQLIQKYVVPNNQCGQQFVFEDSALWEIEHSYNTLFALVQVYVDEKVVDAKVTIVDESNIQINFSGTNVSGYANIVFATANESCVI